MAAPTHTRKMKEAIVAAITRWANAYGNDPFVGGVPVNATGGFLQHIKGWNVVAGKKLHASDVFRSHMAGYATLERRSGTDFVVLQRGVAAPPAGARRAVAAPPAKPAFRLLDSPDDAGELRRLLEPTMRASGTASVGLDLEGVSLGSGHGSARLVQISGIDPPLAGGAVLLVDVHKAPALVNELRALLESDKVVKVLHDCRMDSRALYVDYDVRLRCVFDTQLAYQRLVPESAVDGAQPGLTQVLKRYAGAVAAGPVAKRKDAVKTMLNENYRMWSERPLPGVLLEYAADDVALLGRARSRMIAELGADAVAELMREGLHRARCAAGRDRPPVAVAVAAAPQPAEPAAKVIERGWLDVTAGGEIRRTHVDAGEADAIAGEAADAAAVAARVQKELAGDGRASSEEDETRELGMLLDVLPECVRELYCAEARPGDTLIDVCIDVGRPATVRVVGADRARRTLYGAEPVNADELREAVDAIGGFGNKNRAGVEGTLHRVSGIRDREGRVVGLTARAGRSFRCSERLVPDVVAGRRSLLIVGRPGSGKTTALRDLARVLSSREAARSVMIVDTSNEIAGEGIVPHHSVGNARRMMVAETSQQHATMVEAVQNHTPDVIIIDEIGTSQEALAACSIAQRGVQLVATAHGCCLLDVVASNDLNRLTGGKASVIMSSALARERNSEKQSRVERAGKPAFGVVIEMDSPLRWVVQDRPAEAIDRMLEGKSTIVEVREVRIDRETDELRTWYQFEQRAGQRPENGGTAASR